MKHLSIYLCGQKYFGALTLDMLWLLGYHIAGVSAPLSRTDGTPDRLWAKARGYNIPILPAGMVNADTIPDGVDLIISAHSFDFIGRRTRLRAGLGAIGFHPSLLPIHRGRDAVRWAIHMGEKVTGGSVYWLDDNVDGGPIAAQDWCFIRPDDTASALWRRELQPMGIRLFEQVIGDIDHGRLVRTPQNEILATREPSWERPPLRRPDLLMLGPLPDGYRVIRERAETGRSAEKVG